MEIDVAEFIYVIRNSFHGSEFVYKNGSCYKFYEILKFIFPDTEPFYKDSHVVSKIKNRYYDITGEVFGNFVPFTYLLNDFEEIKNNCFGYYGDILCPNCDEIISVNIVET